MNYLDGRGRFPYEYLYTCPDDLDEDLDRGRVSIERLWPRSHNSNKYTTELLQVSE